MNAILEQHITAALRRNRAQIDGSGNTSGIRPQDDSQKTWATWQADYGTRNETTAKAAVEPARLSHGIGWYSDGSGSSSGKDRMDNSGSRSVKALWREVNRHLCNGTKFFAVCAGIAAFIVVI